MKVVLVLFKDDQRRDFPVKPGKTTIGRARDCQLRVPTADVSRRHCELEVSGAEITIRDLGSSNGTYVNGKRIAETRLKPGDRVVVGPARFVVQIDGQPASISPADAAVAPDTAAGTGAFPLDEEETEELLDLDEIDFDLDDPMSALEAEDEDDEDERRSRKKK